MRRIWKVWTNNDIISIKMQKNLQKNYFTTEPCYSFIINGQNYIIPPQYNDYAEKVFNSGTQFNDEYYKD